MENLQAKIIRGMISKENRKNAVEIQGFVMMLHAESKCNDTLVSDVEKYIEILAILYQKFNGLSLYQIQRKKNPIEQKDFALLTKFHVELSGLLGLAKEKLL